MADEVEMKLHQFLIEQIICASLKDAIEQIDVIGGLYVRAFVYDGYLRIKSKGHIATNLSSVELCVGVGKVITNRLAVCYLDPLPH